MYHMDETIIIRAIAGALMMFGLVLIIGAVIAYSYEESEVVGLRIVTYRPFREHALSLGIIGAGSILAGLTAYALHKPEEATNEKETRQVKEQPT